MSVRALIASGGLCDGPIALEACKTSVRHRAGEVKGFTVGTAQVENITHFVFDFDTY